jgi:hypothetical protein
MAIRGTDTSSAQPYREGWHERAVFELSHARHGVRVGAGIAAAVVAIGLGVGLLVVFPEWARQQVEPWMLLGVALVLLGAVAGAVRLASGPAVALCVESDLASLITRSGATLARCTIDELSPEPVTCQLSTIAIPALVLRFPGRRALTVGVNWPEERLPWRSGTERRGEPTHLVDTALWLPLLAELRLADAFAHPEQVTAAPQPPAALASRSVWRRYAAWSPAAIPIVVLLIGVAWPGMAEPSPDCWAAARCCLAMANGQPPVSAEPLRACTALALGDEERCPGLLSEAQQQAAAAGISCDDSVVERYESFEWSEQARSVPGPHGQWSPEPRYPRVSCHDAALALARAVKQAQPGKWLVIRPMALMVQAITLEDPNAILYCDGYPLPVAEPQMASERSPMVEATGPHAVLLRPRPDGRFQVGQYCLGCNSVGKEPTRR